MTTESALPTTVTGSILHYLPTCKSSEVGGFKLIFALLWPSDVTLCVCCQSCAGNDKGQQGGSRGWNCSPKSLSTVPRSPLPACSSLRSSSKPRYGHSSWGCSSPELLPPLGARGGTKFCCCIYWCCAGSGHPLSPPWVLRALLWVAEGEEELPEGHQQQSPALGCHGRRVCVQDVTRCPMRCTRLCQRAHKHHESTKARCCHPGQAMVTAGVCKATTVLKSPGKPKPSEWDGLGRSRWAEEGSVHESWAPGTALSRLCAAGKGLETSEDGPGAKALLATREAEQVWVAAWEWWWRRQG